MKPFLPILLLTAITSVNAAELFGVNLTNATRDELRLAVKKAGVKLIQEAGAGAFYDTYKGSSVLHRADHLYLGFVKKDNKFAFAEYEFNGREQPVMLTKLNKKYGAAQIAKGKFMSDKSYSWFSKGIEITFYQDWQAYKMRLIYANPEALIQLKKEQHEFKSALMQQNKNYLEQAY